jgi:hypothetical protein
MIFLGMGEKRGGKESIADNKLPHYQHHAPPKKKKDIVTIPTT